MTEQTGDVLADIDAALEGWHGQDWAVSDDAMRWAPDEPVQGQPVRFADLTPEQQAQVIAELRTLAAGVVQSFREAFGPGSEFAQRCKLMAKGLQAFAKAVDPVLPLEFRARRVDLKVGQLDARRSAALEAVRSRSTGPAGPRLDGRRR